MPDVENSEQVLPDRSLPWPINWDGIVLIATREGLRLTSYQCIAGVYTIGWGETDGIGPNMVWTQAQADQKLLEQLKHYAAQVLAMCTLTPNANQLAGLVSCAYNIGLQSLKGSTILKRHNEGNFDAAARAFVLWNQYTDPKTGKRVISEGLTLRRKQESALYLTPMPDAVGGKSQDMPQKVAPESSLAASPINLGAAATIGSGTLGLLTQAGDSADKAKGAIDQVTGAAITVQQASHGLRGVLAEFDLTPLEVICPVAIIGACVAIWYRGKQRSAGYA